MPTCPKCLNKLIKRKSDMAYHCARHGKVREIKTPPLSYWDGTERMTNYEAMDEEFTFVPHHMRDGYKLWIEHGILPGSFGEALLRNDLKGAMGKADDINSRHIKSTVAWFYNFSPSNCWGSVQNVNDWMAGFKMGKKIE